MLDNNVLDAQSMNSMATGKVVWIKHLRRGIKPDIWDDLVLYETATSTT